MHRVRTLSMEWERGGSHNKIASIISLGNWGTMVAWDEALLYYAVLGKYRRCKVQSVLRSRDATPSGYIIRILEQRQKSPDAPSSNMPFATVPYACTKENAWTVPPKTPYSISRLLLLE